MSEPKDEIARVTEAIRTAYLTAGHKRSGIKRTRTLSKEVCGDLAIAAIAAIRRANKDTSHDG